MKMIRIMMRSHSNLVLMSIVSVKGYVINY